MAAKRTKKTKKPAKRKATSKARPRAAEKCSKRGCKRTDLAAHPRGGKRDVCHGHDSTYMDCNCCEATFISEPLKVDRDRGGWPVCTRSVARTEGRKEHVHQVHFHRQTSTTC